MRNGELTASEQRLLQRLLADKGITRYEIVGAVGEGEAMPGSTVPGELESLSGFVVTPSTAFSFWLSWDATRGTYTLGSEGGAWDELSTAQRNREEIVEARRRLQQ